MRHCGISKRNVNCLQSISTLLCTKQIYPTKIIGPSRLRKYTIDVEGAEDVLTTTTFHGGSEHENITDMLDMLHSGLETNMSIWPPDKLG
jgi:hypothetical protein